MWKFWNLKYGEDSLCVVGFFFCDDFFLLFLWVVYGVGESYSGEFYCILG